MADPSPPTQVDCRPEATSPIWKCHNLNLLPPPPVSCIFLLSIRTPSCGPGTQL